MTREVDYDRLIIMISLITISSTRKVIIQTRKNTYHLKTNKSLFRTEFKSANGRGSVCAGISTLCNYSILSVWRRQYIVQPVDIRSRNKDINQDRTCIYIYIHEYIIYTVITCVLNIFIPSQRLRGGSQKVAYIYSISYTFDTLHYIPTCVYIYIQCLYNDFT